MELDSSLCSMYDQAMTTTHRPELTPVLNHKGRQRYADAGATAQGEPKALKRCGACGSHVAFVQSAKTGKWYLANCYPYAGDNDAWYYVKSSPHFKTCADQIKINQAMNI